MNLSYFSQKDFYKSLKQFFGDLNIPLNPVIEAPDSADSILSDTYNPNNPAHKLMDDVYFVGMVSEDAFTKQRDIKYTAAAEEIKTKDYDCMLLFGVTLKTGDRTPSRTQLAEITRAFNRQFSYYPVVVVFKYGETIAFANCERLAELTEKQRQQIIAAFEDAKILDPACGSGAFPMGILQKMVRVLEKLDPKNERWKQALIKRTPIEARKEMETILEGNTADYSRKLGIIQNCIYGVDIQPIAIQVSKLRFFISLLVDFSVDKSKHNFGIQPLPNLDYKLMQGNSLIEDFHGFTLNLKEQDTDDESGHLFCEKSQVVSLIEDLWDKQSEYLRESRPKQKDKLREDVETDIVNIFDTYIRQKKAPYFAEFKKMVEMTQSIPTEKRREEYLKAEKTKLDKKYNFDYVAVEKELKSFTHGMKPRNFFPWQLYFADVFSKKGGFDVVIGNPPYIRADAGAEHLALRQRILESKRYETLWEKWDLFIPFIEFGYNVLKPNGITTMIVSDAYCHSKYAQKSQEWFLRKSRIIRLDFLSKIKVFDAGVHNIVYFFQKADGTTNKPERFVHEDEFGKIKKLSTDEQQNLTYRAFFPEEGGGNNSLFCQLWHFQIFVISVSEW